MWRNMVNGYSIKRGKIAKPPMIVGGLAFGSIFRCESDLILTCSSRFWGFLNRMFFNDHVLCNGQDIEHEIV